MISFKEFLLETSRMQEMPLDSALVWMENYAEDYLTKGNFIFRGVTGKNGIMHGDTSSGTDRKSANTFNFYTLWMDNHPSFKEFPKRGRSFICTPDIEYSRDYGKPYIVIPKDASPVGVCQTNDIWGTIIEGHLDLIELNNVTGNALHDSMDLDDFPKTYASLVKNFKEITHDDTADSVGHDDDVPTLMRKYNCANLFELWEKIVTPKLFELKSGDNMPSQKREVWIQEDCVFISTNPGDLTASEQMDMLEFAEKFPKFKALLLKFWDEGVSYEGTDKIDVDKISDKDALTYSQKQKPR